LKEKFTEFLQTNNNQFGFKKGIGCNHAVYIVKGAWPALMGDSLLWQPASYFNECISMYFNEFNECTSMNVFVVLFLLGK